MFLQQVLTPVHLDGLKKRVYAAEGQSLTEPVMQQIWWWLAKRIPLWIAPNVITMAGLLVNVVTSFIVMWCDPNSLGVAPQWTYLLCSFGIFIYQTMDAMDGKQHIRTETDSPLAEIFDHGCDAFSTFLILLVAGSAVGLNQWPYWALAFVLSLEVLNYLYHWETHVAGVIYYNLFDITEGQFAQMVIMAVSFYWGPVVWLTEIPGLDVSVRSVLLAAVMGNTLYNGLKALVIILTKGRNGLTTAHTHILLPFVPLLAMIASVVCYALISPNRMLENNFMLFMIALAGPLVKYNIHMLISGMCLAPLPVFDPILFGQLLAIGNVLLGNYIPEFYMLVCVAVFNVVDIVAMYSVAVKEVSDAVNVSVFTVPYPPPSMRKNQ